MYTLGGEPIIPASQVYTMRDGNNNVIVYGASMEHCTQIAMYIHQIHSYQPHIKLTPVGGQFGESWYFSGEYLKFIKEG